MYLCAPNQNIMKKKELTSTFTIYQMDELDQEQRELVEVAKAQVHKSYSPYSHFQVGAAAKLANGVIIKGSNQENAAYPSGLCAERTALFAAGATYPEEKVTMLAIACFTNGHYTAEPGSPCGSCRQVMVETEHRYPGNMQVLLYGETCVYVCDSAKDLLPLSFLTEDLQG